jgi:hypothetical protein
MIMSESLAAAILGGQGGSPQLVVRGYLISIDPVTGSNVVRVTGNQDLLNVTLFCAIDDLSPGPVALINTSGGPAILGPVIKPTAT